MAVDGSERDRTVVAAARKLALCTGGEVFVLRVCHLVVTGLLSAYDYEDPDEAAATVDRLVHSLESSGVSAIGDVVEVWTARARTVARAICSVADGWQADAIVIGSPGPHELGGVVLGRATQKVLRHARRALLVVPAIGTGAGQGGDSRSENFLVPSTMK